MLCRKTVSGRCIRAQTEQMADDLISSAILYIYFYLFCMLLLSLFIARWLWNTHELDRC